MPMTSWCLSPAIHAALREREQDAVAHERDDAAPGGLHRRADLFVVGVDRIGQLDVERLSGMGLLPVACALSDAQRRAQQASLLLPHRPHPPAGETIRAWPVTKLESSLASRSAAGAMSSGSPARWIGWWVARMGFIFSAISSAAAPETPRAWPKIGVAMPPGQMQFTRTPLSPSSIATEG